MINRVIGKALLIALLGFAPVMGQTSLEKRQPELLFEEGLFHYERGYYGQARTLFRQSRDAAPDALSTLRSESAFYEALSASQLENEDASFLLERFLEDYPQSPRLSHARFRLGEIAQSQNRLRIALRWYEKVDAYDLEREVRLRYFFKSGYVHFMEGDYDKASGLLAQAKDTPSQWWSSANYYYAHIQYEQGNHVSALRTFEKLLHEPGFEKVVPFYIAQIYYMQGDYDKAIEYGSPLMAEAKGVMRTDMARVLGDSWFAKEQYSQAIPYHSIVVADTKTARREDFYHLGLSYYFIGDYKQAANFLAQVTSGEDAMTQNAYYHLGDCYIRQEDKKNARIAFEAATRYAFDAAIREDAMFNYIKLNYELSFSPFNEIINSFLQFIEEFPNSAHIDEAYSYLGQALLTTKNYRQALEAMERIRHKNADVYRAMQRVAYYRGLELFTNLQFTESIGLFDYSLKYGDYDRNLKTAALYWRGEARYRLNDYRGALTDYTSFIQSPGSRTRNEFVTAHYNIGYTHFKLGNYSESGTWFRQFINNKQNNQDAMVSDALNRIGDTYFMSRDFNNAISFYDRASKIPGGSADYAMFQKAVSLGISRNHQEKISQLDALIRQFPTSPYVDDAYFELGRSYVHLNRLDDAVRSFKTVRDRFPRSSFANKSMLQLGLVYYNQGDLDQSMVYYKRVVNEFPGTPEAEDALLGIRNIYMDQNDPNGYIRYTNQIGGFARVDDRQRDSLSYVAAERLYMAGNCQQALPQLESYLHNFPQGRFVLNAHYYKADCQYNGGNLEAALKSFEFVSGRGKSLFSEDAVKRAGEIHFRNENYPTALDYFKRLEEDADLEENRQEALIGQMRSLAKMNNPASALEATRRVIANTRMAPEIVREARYLKATSHMALNQRSDAMIEYRELSANTSSREGAEAKFRVADLHYQDGKPEEAEKVIFDFVNKGTPHQYWLARSFILLSDIYAARGEYFQAAQYLESLLENYQSTDDDIRQMAMDKLDRYKSQAAR
jgi:TolA-binding protein